jgi:hypothetical protein
MRNILDEMTEISHREYRKIKIKIFNQMNIKSYLKHNYSKVYTGLIYGKKY